MHWLVQTLASAADTFVGRMPWLGWPLLLGYLWLLRKTAHLTVAELAEPWLIGAVIALGQVPGLALSAYVAISFVFLSGMAMDSVSLLQIWTAIWTPLLLLLPNGWVFGRPPYVWMIVVLPWLQAAWLWLGASNARAGDQRERS